MLSKLTTLNTVDETAIRPIIGAIDKITIKRPYDFIPRHNMKKTSNHTIAKLKAN